jgi:vacuolar-type H+-ATPase subunit H
MSDISTLEKIKKREDSADRETAEAKERASHIVADAKKKAEETVRKADDKAQEDYKAALDAAAKEAARKADDIRAQQKGRIAALKDVKDADVITTFGDALADEFGA